MNSKVVISICCITFNHADYIEKCIEGFLAQKFPHKMEIIIGDDLSSDGTREKLQKIQLQHPDLIKVIYNQENMGANKNILFYVRPKESLSRFVKAMITGYMRINYICNINC
ncbi:glycosyltransferase family 2 protein [Escherichia coli]|uniref:glycosyltransferase family 2 protein n=1 Tax=Escherichia coli TaxID=562 RepID=UPI003891F757